MHVSIAVLYRLNTFKSNHKKKAYMYTAVCCSIFDLIRCCRVNSRVHIVIFTKLRSLKL